MAEPIYTAIVADDETTTAFLTETLEKLIENYGIERVLVDTSNSAGTLIATLAAEKGLDLDLFDAPIYGIDADAPWNYVKRPPASSMWRMMCLNTLLRTRNP